MDKLVSSAYATYGENWKLRNSLTKSVQQVGVWVRVRVRECGVSGTNAMRIAFILCCVDPWRVRMGLRPFVLDSIVVTRWMLNKPWKMRANISMAQKIRFDMARKFETVWEGAHVYQLLKIYKWANEMKVFCNEASKLWNFSTLFCVSELMPVT